MIPKIYKVNVHTTIVIAATDEAEAERASVKHCLLDGMTQVFDDPVRVTSIDQLPEHWDGRELAFSNHRDGREPWGQQSIKHWLNEHENERVQN